MDTLELKRFIASDSSHLLKLEKESRDEYEDKRILYHAELIELGIAPLKSVGDYQFERMQAHIEPEPEITF
jgi:hypothetical protein